MDNTHYLLSVTTSGIKCLEREVRLDFYKKTIDKDFEPDQYRIKAIYGENGSGKSSIITAVKLFQDIMLNKQYLNESSNQKLLNEIINKKTGQYKFECEYLTKINDEAIIYKYLIELGRGDGGIYEIKHEKLMARSGSYASSKYRSIYETIEGKLTLINCMEEQKKNIDEVTYNLLNKSTLITSVITDLKRIEINDRAFMYGIIISFLLVVQTYVYLADEDQHELYFLKKIIEESHITNNGLFDDVGNITNYLDRYMSVNDRIVAKKYFEQYEERIENLTRFLKLFKKDLVDIQIDAKDDGDFYRCELNLDYGEYVVNKEFESTGIKKLISLYDCFNAVDRGEIVFIDEMDSNLNDVYLCKLIEYFMYYGKGQLCFTTHNLDPMAVLKDNKNSIDFLSNDNHLVSWISNGNASPENYYKNGMIEDSPFNIEATDFIGMFEGR